MINEPMEKIQGRIVNLGPCEICGKPVQVAAAVHKLYQSTTTCSRKCGEQLAQRQTEQKESESVGKHRQDKETLIAKVRDEIAKGRTAYAVAKELGIAKSTLHNWLHTEPKEVDRPTNEQLRLDYFETKGSKSALMRKYHVGWYTVEKWCKEAGIKIDDKPKVENKIEPPTTKDGRFFIKCFRCDREINPLIDGKLILPDDEGKNRVYCYTCGATKQAEAKPIRSMGCVEPYIQPLGVEVPNYEPSDNDWQVEDEEPIPYTVDNRYETTYKERIIRRMDRQEAKGQGKYKYASLADNPAEMEGRLTHLAEELVDGLYYIEWIIDKLRTA